MQYIREKYLKLYPLYEEIYIQGSRTYWEALDERVRAYARQNSLEYVRDDSTIHKPFDEPPVIVNFFYHEEIKKSAKKGR
ncbi:MAG TPA: radical SAM protein [Candidatus Ventricola intestinavium]|nr:radical SAM protein [Candidatus Ventricola intestinavium]